MTIDMILSFCGFIGAIYVCWLIWHDVNAMEREEAKLNDKIEDIRPIKDRIIK